MYINSYGAYPIRHRQRNNAASRYSLCRDYSTQVAIYNLSNKETRQNQISTQEIAAKLDEYRKNPIPHSLFNYAVSANPDKDHELYVYKVRKGMFGEYKKDYSLSYRSSPSNSYKIYNQILWGVRKELFSVSVPELATAYLKLWEEYELYRTLDNDIEWFDWDWVETDKRFSKLRLASRSCGVYFQKSAYIHKTGAVKAIKELSGQNADMWTEYNIAKALEKEFQRPINEQFDFKGDKGTLDEDLKDCMPWFYALLTLIVEIYREGATELGLFDNRLMYPSPKFEMITGFDIVKYYQDGTYEHEKDIAMSGTIFSMIVVVIMCIIASQVSEISLLVAFLITIAGLFVLLYFPNEFYCKGELDVKNKKNKIR